MEYTVEITEILQKQIQVEADSKEQAEDIARDLYSSGEEALLEADLKETIFEVLYDLFESKYTIKQLREGYREITGLDNDKDMSDEDIYNYMLEALKEE